MITVQDILNLLEGSSLGWVGLIVCPAVLLAAGLLLAIFRLGRAYTPAALFLGAVGLFFVACGEATVNGIFCYLALYTAFAVLVRLLFLIPFGGKKRAKDREQEMYERFRTELKERPYEAESAPVKINCFEPEETITMQESGLRVEHVEEQLERLRKCKLSPSDRLETDVLARSLDAYRNRELTREELRSLNDCLASVLKLTAKYKL